MPLPNSRRESMFLGRPGVILKNPEGIVCFFSTFSHKIPSGFGDSAMFCTRNIDSLREFGSGCIGYEVVISSIFTKCFLSLSAHIDGRVRHNNYPHPFF